MTRSNGCRSTHRPIAKMLSAASENLYPQDSRSSALRIACYPFRRSPVRMPLHLREMDSTLDRRVRQKERSVHLSSDRLRFQHFSPLPGEIRDQLSEKGIGPGKPS